jgi:hypothetical protein
MEEESTTAKNLVGIISNRTLYEKVLSFTDADQETKRMEDEEITVDDYSGIGA